MVMKTQFVVFLVGILCSDHDLNVLLFLKMDRQGQKHQALHRQARDIDFKLVNYFE